METNLQGRRPSQQRRNISISQLSVIVLTIVLLVLALCSCATSKNALPFYEAKKYGKNPVKKNKPAGKQTAWTYRQWGHEGR